MREPKRTGMMLGLLLAICGCKARQPDSVPLVHGGKDSSVEYSVALTEGGRAFCSGVALCPTAVLTARHCLYSFYDDKLEKRPENLKVSASSNVSGPKAVFSSLESTYAVSDTWRVPDVFGKGKTVTDGLVLLKIKESEALKLSTYAPLPSLEDVDARAKDAPSDWIDGGGWLALGYGRDQRNGTGRKLQGELALDPAGYLTSAEGPTLLLRKGFDSQITCGGDSGGGLLVTLKRPSGRSAPAIVGILHGGTMADCTKEPGKQDLSLFLSLIHDNSSSDKQRPMAWIYEQLPSFCPKPSETDG